MYSIYVYYRIDPRHIDAAETPIRAMMARLTCRFGVTAQLLKKRDEPLLWMETYEGITDATLFERELSKMADEYDVDVFLDGERHVECFLVDVT